jgi:hypothetical protein
MMEEPIVRAKSRPFLHIFTQPHQYFCTVIMIDCYALSQKQNSTLLQCFQRIYAFLDEHVQACSRFKIQVTLIPGFCLSRASMCNLCWPVWPLPTNSKPIVSISQMEALLWGILLSRSWIIMRIMIGRGYLKTNVELNCMGWWGANFLHISRVLSW